jgi:hypothetical protein
MDEQVRCHKRSIRVSAYSYLLRISHLQLRQLTLRKPSKKGLLVSFQFIKIWLSNIVRNPDHFPPTTLLYSVSLPK